MLGVVVVVTGGGRQRGLLWLRAGRGPQQRVPMGAVARGRGMIERVGGRAAERMQGEGVCGPLEQNQMPT